MALFIDCLKIRQLILYPLKIIQVAAFFDKATNNYTSIKDPRHVLIVLPKNRAYVGKSNPLVP